MRIVTSLVRPALAGVPAAARFASGVTALVWEAPAAFAEETSAVTAPPDDTFVVAFALFLFVATLALNASLGDVVGDEAQLPSSVNLINKSRARRSSFIKGNSEE